MWNKITIQTRVKSHQPAMKAVTNRKITSESAGIAVTLKKASEDECWNGPTRRTTTNTPKVIVTFLLRVYM